MADSSACHLQSLNLDLVSDIISRLDGSTLAATACTSSHLRDASSDQSLWRRLCHSNWPSTSSPKARHLISSSPSGSFAKFYTESFPLVLYDESLTHQITHPPARISPSEFTSFVDVHYKGKCILSRVLDGIPDAVDVSDDNNASFNDRQRWFSNCPFKLDLLGFSPYKDASNENNEQDRNSNIHSANDEHWGDLCEKLTEDMRLSWVLFDKKGGKAVNLSCGKPLRVQKSWSSDAEYVMSFGCIVPVEECVVPHKLAECVITARCKMTEKGEWIRWSEVSMSLVDMEGSHINGKKSLMVLNQALHSLRSNRRVEVEKGYNRFKRQREELKKRRECRESLADKLCASVEIAVFLAICYACNALF